MDSSKTSQHASTLTTTSATATIATSSSESPPDSFSDFVNNLFPSEPVKCDSAAQGFNGLESPPFVFSSPHLNTNSESNLLERTHYAQSSNAELVADFKEVAGTGIMQPLSRKDEQNIEANLAPELSRLVKSEKEQSPAAFYSTESGLPTPQAFEKLENEDLCAQDTCITYQNGLDFMRQFLHQQLINANSHGAFECNDKETHGVFQPLPVAQTQPSMRQCFLQFKEAAANAPQNNLHSSNFTSNAKATSHYPSMVEGTELSVVNLDSAFNNRVSANSSHSVHTLLHPDSDGNPPSGVSKPSGIGLHLNSVINAVVKNHGPTAGLVEQGIGCHILKNENICSGDVSYSAQDQGHGSKAISLTSSITLEPYRAVKPEKFETPYKMRNFDFDKSVNLEKKNLPPKRKRKKSSVNSSGDNSKRCNCKKTNCLKLYCDCFAAGSYCSESCSCQGCFNNSENEDTVLEARRQCESRDPLAFAPKVIEDRNELPLNNENGSQLTPSLARHKRGCSCKKSMCLKQYCECFQANVGCTIRCRCVDCKNFHGKKKERWPTPELASGRGDVGRLEGRLIHDHDTAALRIDISHSEFYGQQHNLLAPQTPSFQYSDHEKDSPKSRLLSRRGLPSPEFDATSSSSTDCNDLFLETMNELLDVDPYQWQQQINCDHGGTSWINVSRTGLPFTGGSSVVWRRSPDNTPLTRSGETSYKSIGGSSPKKKQVLPPQGSENEVGINSSGWLKSRRYVLKSMPPFSPLTPLIDSGATNASNGSDSNDINTQEIEPQCRW